MAAPRTVFVSRAGEDAPRIAWLNDALGRSESAWQISPVLPVRDDWRVLARAAIRSADVFVFVSSTRSLRSANCGDELALAIEAGKPIVNVVLDDAAPPTNPDLSTASTVRAATADPGATVTALLAALTAVPQVTGDTATHGPAER